MAIGDRLGQAVAGHDLAVVALFERLVEVGGDRRADDDPERHVASAGSGGRFQSIMTIGPTPKNTVALYWRIRSQHFAGMEAAVEDAGRARSTSAGTTNHAAR